MYDILRLLRNSDLFTSIEVLKLIDEEPVRFLKIKAHIKDGSILYMTEMNTGTYQKYSYHWQKANGELIIRWDNKPHWQDLKTFPHHKHVGSEVFPCHHVSLEEVLTEIKNKQKSG